MGTTHFFPLKNPPCQLCSFEVKDIAIPFLTQWRKCDFAISKNFRKEEINNNGG